MSDKEYKITLEDSIEALKNEYRDILETYDSKVVSIERKAAPEGTLCLFQFTVKVPTFYLTSQEDANPKSTNEIVFFVQVSNGFPRVKPFVYYPSNRYLASVNVFRNGVQCIDEWTESSSLSTVVEKTLKDIIHDPIVTKYDSMANSSLESWQKSKTEQRVLPTVEPKVLYKKAREVRLPVQSAPRVQSVPPLPPMPGRA